MKIVRVGLLQYKITGIPQNELEASFAYNISKEEEYISFNDDVNKVYDHIRGLIDWPVGYGVVNGHRIKIYQAKKELAKHDFKAGKIIKLENDKIKVACNNGYILLEEVQMEGKKRLSAKDFYNGSKNLLQDAYFE